MEFVPHAKTQSENTGTETSSFLMEVKLRIQILRKIENHIAICSIVLYKNNVY